MPASCAISSIDAAWYPRPEKICRAASRIAARRSGALRRLRAGFESCVAAITERSVSWVVPSDGRGQVKQPTAGPKGAGNVGTRGDHTPRTFRQLSPRRLGPADRPDPRDNGQLRDVGGRI